MIRLIMKNLWARRRKNGWLLAELILVSNVIMTQHMAFYTDAAVQSMVFCGIEGLCDFARTGHTATELV